MLERTVKAKVRELIARFGASAWQHWPVVTRFGATDLDVIGAIHGVAFCVECKRPGEVPTERQNDRLAERAGSGTAVFVIDDPAGPAFREFERWLGEINVWAITTPTREPRPTATSAWPIGRSRSMSSPTSTRAAPRSSAREKPSPRRPDSTALTAPTAEKKYPRPD